MFASLHRGGQQLLHTLQESGVAACKAVPRSTHLDLKGHGRGVAHAARHAGQQLHNVCKGDAARQRVRLVLEHAAGAGMWQAAGKHAS